MKAINRFVAALLVLLLFTISSTKALTVDYSGLISESSEEKSPVVILIDIHEMRLHLIDKTTKNIIKSYPIATGRLELPSPLGTWRVIHKGQWNEGFGGRWLGLNVPWGTYGIHGTTRPSSIGTYASHGCIRMFTSDVTDLYPRVPLNTIVIIYGGPSWLFTSYIRDIAPGDRGTDVFAVQRRLQILDYYKGSLDGIYGEGMKAAVLEFRDEHGLPPSHNIDREMLKALGIFLFE